MTIDELIKELREAKKRHPLGGKCTVAFSGDHGSLRSESGPWVVVTELTDEQDEKSAVEFLGIW